VDALIGAAIQNCNQQREAFGARRIPALLFFFFNQEVSN